MTADPAPTILASPDPVDILLDAREALSARVDRLTALLTRHAGAWDDCGDYFDGVGKPALALECRRFARECREAIR